MMLTESSGNTDLKKITIECENGGERLDVFLAVNLPDLTRNAVQKLIEAGKVTLNGAAAAKSHRTTAGEAFCVEIDEPADSDALPQDIPLDIIFEDEDVIIINKPRGMVVHPAPGHSDGTLVNALLFHCGDSISGIGGVKRPGIVHRIDKDTSGLLIAAKNDHAHLALSAQLSARTLTREYDAVVCGRMKDTSGTINAPIGRHPADRKRQAVTETNSRSAITHYELVCQYDGYAHVRCKLETGRTHQIRVHMAHIGRPVLGDLVYGWKKAELGITGQCLHARRIKLVHPVTGATMEFSTELPDYFADVLAQLEKRSRSLERYEEDEYEDK